MTLLHSLTHSMTLILLLSAYSIAADGWCNVAGSNRKEDRDDRWEGADRYRGGGAWSRRCDYVNNRDPFVMHIFGKENDWTWSRNAAIRRC